MLFSIQSSGFNYNTGNMANSIYNEELNKIL